MTPSIKTTTLLWRQHPLLAQGTALSLRQLHQMIEKQGNCVTDNEHDEQLQENRRTPV
jgi:hypothetical protein